MAIILTVFLVLSFLAAILVVAASIASAQVTRARENQVNINEVRKISLPRNVTDTRPGSHRVDTKPHFRGA